MARERVRRLRERKAAKERRRRKRREQRRLGRQGARAAAGPGSAAAHAAARSSVELTRDGGAARQRAREQRRRRLAASEAALRRRWQCADQRRIAEAAQASTPRAAEGFGDAGTTGDAHSGVIVQGENASGRLLRAVYAGAASSRSQRLAKLALASGPIAVGAGVSAGAFDELTVAMFSNPDVVRMARGSYRKHLAQRGVSLPPRPAWELRRGASSRGAVVTDRARASLRAARLARTGYFR